MSTPRPKLILCALACLVGFSAGAQEPATSAPGIAHYCADRATDADHRREAALLFFAVPQNSNPALDRWSRAASQQELEFAERNGDSTASVSLQTHRPVWINFTFQSQFGDWVTWATYCYRPDGSLAILHSELKSFHGNLRVVRNRYYAPNGRLLSRSENSWDLATNLPKKIPPDFWDQPAPIFLHSSDLPFAHQLPRKPNQSRNP
jgi:hypothetical protein